MKQFLIFVLLVLSAVLAVSLWNQRRGMPDFGSVETPMLAAIDQETTQLIQTVVPSVVSITTRKAQTQTADPLEFLFGRRHGNPPIGSGVIVSKEGHILTNYHVVANVDEVHVQLADGRPPFPARFIGGDETTDIAVIQIDAKGLRPLLLGDSDAVRVGQLVFAIGNPFGLQETVTKGIISATGRITDEYGPEYFQTEAVINPGNSGGPLINIRGEIIGINSAIGNYSGSGTWQGVGFAIPSNTARRVLEAILQTGRVARGYLGVFIAPLTPELAAQYGLAPEQTGAFIRDIPAGSPAETAGLQQGDLLVAFDGKPIRNVTDLVRQVVATPPGTTVEVQVIRNGRKQTFSVTLREPPAGMKIGPSPTP